MKKTAQRALRFAAAITTLAALALPVSAGSAHASGFPYKCGNTGGEDFQWYPGGVGKDIYLQEGTGYCTGSPLTFELVLQGDGNLVIYNSSGRARWASNTDIHNPTQAVMQTDGNFVVYSGGHALWSTRTNNNSGAYLCFQNDGNLVVYTGVVVGCDGYPIWATGT
jgi:hypothetical protein